MKTSIDFESTRHTVEDAGRLLLLLAALAIMLAVM
jgi:hypothetical protein